MTEIERNLNTDFSDVCDCFLDNKLSIHFGEDKAKCIPFGIKHGLNKVSSLDIKYGKTVTYLGCLLDETLSGESMALKTKLIVGSYFYIEKTGSCLRLFRRLLCKSLSNTAPF